jgi:hypothetical protein
LEPLINAVCIAYISIVDVSLPSRVAFTCMACVEQLPPCFPINKAASSNILSPDARWLAESLSLSLSPDVIGVRQPGWPQQGWAFLGPQHDMETRKEERKEEAEEMCRTTH